MSEHYTYCRAWLGKPGCDCDDPQWKAWHALPKEERLRLAKENAAQARKTFQEHFSAWKAEQAKNKVKK